MFKTLTWWRATYRALGKQKVHLLYISIQSADILNFHCLVNILVANCKCVKPGAQCIPLTSRWIPHSQMLSKEYSNCSLFIVTFYLTFWHLPDRETDMLIFYLTERLTFYVVQYGRDLSQEWGVERCISLRRRHQCWVSMYQNVEKNVWSQDLSLVLLVIFKMVNMQTRNIWLPHLLATS